MGAQRDTVRVAALGDVHCARTSKGTLHALFSEIAETADVLLICGDCTDYGLADEARILVQELNTKIRIPVLAVLGNHDYHSGQTEEVMAILRDGGVVVLDGDGCDIHGVGFVGVKGFGGGFGERALGSWGEEIIKRFVHETIDEALKLEAALARLHTPQRVVLLHYAPIVGTVEGEPCDVFPFLGSSRLEEPLNRYPVTAVFHGHAHAGNPEAQTAAHVPVYNVAIPVLARAFPDRPPFRVLEIAVGQGQ